MCGYVKDVREFTQKAAVSIAPIFSGGGTRIKILEAWAYGIPVVSTTVGCEGLGAVDGQTLMIADTPELFARRCVEMILHPDMSRDLSERAFTYAKSHFAWSNLEPILDEAIASAARCHRASAKR